MLRLGSSPLTEPSSLLHATPSLHSTVGLVSGSCSSARIFAPRFFRAPPRGECDFTLTLRYGFTSTRLSKGLSPSSCRTCSAHRIMAPREVGAVGLFSNALSSNAKITAFIPQPTEPPALQDADHRTGSTRRPHIRYSTRR